MCSNVISSIATKLFGSSDTSQATAAAAPARAATAATVSVGNGDSNADVRSDGALDVSGITGNPYGAPETGKKKKRAGVPGLGL